MITEPPSVAEEVEDRAIHRERIAALFREHPLEEFGPDELRRVTTHYQQRISECRKPEYFGMNIVNLPKWIEDTSRPKTKKGKPRMKRVDGWYRYEPFERLGRDAGVPTLAPWNQDRPFAETFKLT